MSERERAEGREERSATGLGRLAGRIELDAPLKKAEDEWM